MKKAIKEIYKQRKSLIVIGLTGRTGSGCSTVCNWLSKPIKDWKIGEHPLGDKAENHNRKQYILSNYFKENWSPFFPILIRDIITTFMLEGSFIELNKILKSHNIKPFKKDWETLFNSIKEKNDLLINGLYNLPNKKNKDHDQIFNYLKKDLTNFSTKLKLKLNSDKKLYFKVYQELGTNLRKNGDAFKNGSPQHENIYSIVNRVENIINWLKVYFETNEKKGKPFFVIDALRNPFEAGYFFDRFACFYLMSVNCPDLHRRGRLIDNFKMNDPEITQLDKTEYPEGSPLKDFSSFSSQNIGSCIQKADIHISNEDGKGKSDFRELKGQLVKYFSLILHPGLVPPSKNEKMMQIAFTAKLNSGCISRQVGAVAIDKGGAIRGIGWNSTPEDQVPCVLRSAKLYDEDGDRNSFSYYELDDEEIKTSIQEHWSSLNPEGNEKCVDGLNPSFCFKDIRNSIKSKNTGKEVKDKTYTRSLHAEENAFLQVAKYGGDALEGGVLYTTASPCELCSKKAFQLNLREIIYLDPYPGIAMNQFLNYGPIDKRPTIILFSGVIGRAYQKLYDPILPYKDEINAFVEIQMDWQKG